MEAGSHADVDLVVSARTPDCVFHDPFFPTGIVGRDAMRQVITEDRKAFPDARVRLERMLVKGNRLSAFYTWTGTHSGPLTLPGGAHFPATGVRIRHSAAYMARVTKGKLAEEWLFFNPLDILLPLGYTLVPPRFPSSGVK